ncbi:MAG: LysR substrate-binding domain-containing protein [bacterium]|nr:LysR substrate-binding domain-containing protein [bacterium]MDE0417590.1 LysR substrate-binding domain-containing protein [bacterium]
MEPSLRQIRYFVAAARAGQISRAARELNVSQSAITVAVRQLEEITGCALFQRRVQGVTLTHNGMIFLEHAGRVLTAVDEAVRAPRNTLSQLKGRLRLAMTYTVAGYFLPAYLERFTRAYPHITLQPLETTRSEIESGLVTGDFDIAVLLTSNIADQEGLDFETLFRSPRSLWLPAGHGLLARDEIHLSDVAQEPYIMLTVDEASNTALRYWHHAGVRPRTLMRTSSVEAVRSMVANGMGVTILSGMVYRPWSLEGLRVETVPLASHVPTMDVGLVWPVNAELTAPAKAFAEFMRTSLARDRQTHF